MTIFEPVLSLRKPVNNKLLNVTRGSNHPPPRPLSLSVQDFSGSKERSFFAWSGLINNRLNLFSSRFRTVPYAFKYHWDFPLSGNLNFTNLSYKAMLFVNLLSSFSLTPRCLVWNCDENRMTRFLPRSCLFITTIPITNIIVIVICQLLFYPEGIIFLSFFKKKQQH